MRVRFLLDENQSPALAAALRHRERAIDVLRVGELGAPPLATLDPDVLLFCEAEQRALVTNNRKSMPGHVAAHFAAGHHHWGIFQLTHDISIGELVDLLHLIWSASEAEEYRDAFDYIPWKEST